MLSVIVISKVFSLKNLSVFIMRSSNLSDLSFSLFLKEKVVPRKFAIKIVEGSLCVCMSQTYQILVSQKYLVTGHP